MLKTLAVMLLTAAHSAVANDKVESADVPTNNFEETTNVIVDDFIVLDNDDEDVSIPNDELQALI